MPKLPTPCTSHIPSDSPIYEPAEDSYLFLDTLSSQFETSFLNSRFPPNSSTPLVLEVGTGSGVILAFVAANASHILGRNDVLTLGVDVNTTACSAARTTVTNALHVANTTPVTGTNAATSTNEHPTDAASTFLDILPSSLTTSIRSSTVDLLLFNPPYVPTESVPTLPNPTTSPTSKFTQDSHLFSLAYAGGTDGMEVTNQLLGQLPSVLSERGVAYILFCARNKPIEVRDRVRGWVGGGEVGGKGRYPGRWRWECEVVAESGGKGGWERLSILRIWREVDG